MLRFTDGNPLTLTVLVGQALKDGLETEDQLKSFTEKLQKGEAAFADDQTQGRSKSLAASLSYGFEHAFTEQERKILALLYFFQGVVQVGSLQFMGDPDEDYALPELRGMTKETLTALLNRADEVGLLTAIGGGYYTIHPALPWFFKSLFERFYPNSPSPILGEGLGEGRVTERSRSERAFVEAVGELGSYYHDQYIDGNRDVIHILSKEEPNLLHARRMARAKEWWLAVIKSMQGLRMLYDQTGRRSEWKQLVEEIVPDFVDPATDGPLPGREDQWGLVTNYRVRLAQEERHWAEAERLQTVCVKWDRKQAAPWLQLPPEKLNSTGRNTVRTLAVSFEVLGNIQRELGNDKCVNTYEEAFQLSLKIEDKAEAADCTFNLGHAYMQIPAIRNLEKAEQWYRRSLELRDEKDPIGKGICFDALGNVAYNLFIEARKSQRSEKELLDKIKTALNNYHQALELFPPNAVNNLAVTHNQLGMIYSNAGTIEQAVSHYNQSVRYQEMQGNYYHAGFTRYNIALALMQSGRIPDALDYARAALRNFETYGNRAADRIELVKGLIAELEAVG